MQTEATQRLSRAGDAAVDFDLGVAADRPALRAHSGGFALAAGTRLAEFEIRSLIGEGGFGLVYLAYDLSLQREVAIKEYLPIPLNVRRRDDGSVEPPAGEARHAFDAGLRSFLNEARLLARFDHPALLKVHRCWQAAGTAYLAMPYYEGPTLKAAVRERGARWSEADIRRWLEPLLDALEVLHAERCYHRDIAPDNVLLTVSGPVLLDFGAARRVIEDMTHGITAILKPGYAPIEQYGGGGSGSQGPWTDLYALAGVVRYAMTGNAPVPSVNRIVSDPLRPLSHGGYGPYRAGFLRALDAALAVLPAERPRSVAEFRALLGEASPGTDDAIDVDVDCDIRLPDDADAAPAGVDAAPTMPLPRAPEIAAAPLASPDGPTTKVVPISEPAAPLRAETGRRRWWSRAAAVGAVLCAAVIAVAVGRPSPRQAEPEAASPQPPAGVAAAAPAAPAREAPAATRTDADQGADRAAAPASAPRQTAARVEVVPVHVRATSSRRAAPTPLAAAAVPAAVVPDPVAARTVERPAVEAGDRDAPPAGVRAASARRAEPQPGGPVHDCSELLQRASLGAASEDDTASIRRHCR